MFGGSVGREGTAVQMGGSVAAGVSRFFELAQKEHEILVICGMAGGFSAIFGTPFSGLSLELLADAFQGANYWFDFILKLIFTVLTLGAGYQGGEVTPLFEIGATLGSTLGQFLSLPITFVAALGFIGVFAGATNAPLACFVMGLELFGFSGSGYLIIIVLISYLTSGNQGIYSAQKVNQGKYVRFKRKQT